MVAIPSTNGQPAQRRGVILRRVSTDEQEDNFSLPNQAQACRAFAEQQGIAIVADVYDVHSGYSLKRPGLTQVRELAAAREIDVVIVWKLDRLSRRITHWGKLLSELEDAHVSITSVMEPWLDTATPIGKHMIMTLVFVAEQERQNFMDRSAAGMRNRADKGLPFGGYVPYGYTAIVQQVSGRSGEVVRVGLAVDPLTAPRVVWIFERAADGWSTRRIAKALTAEGVPTPRASAHGIWNSGTISRILKDFPGYWGAPASFRWQKGEDGHAHRKRPSSEWVPLSTEHTPPLITPQLAALAHARLATNNSVAVRRLHNPEAFLLRGGFARCGGCGGSLAAFTMWDTKAAREAGEPPRLRYHCTRNVSRPGICYDGTRNSISARVLDAAVWKEVDAFLHDPARIRRKLAQVSAADPTAKRREQLERQLAEVETERMRAAEAIVKIADAHVSAPLYVKLQELATRADSVLADLAALEGERTSWEQLQAHLTRLEAYAERVSANIESLTYEERRRTLFVLDVHVTVWKPGTHTDEAGAPVRWEGKMQPFGEQAIRFTDAERALSAANGTR
jgi:site-specific DNA recombinase